MVSVACGILWENVTSGVGVYIGRCQRVAVIPPSLGINFYGGSVVILGTPFQHYCTCFCFLLYTENVRRSFHLNLYVILEILSLW